MIQDLDEGFQEGLRELQAEVEVLIPAGVDIGEGINLWRFLRGGPTTEVLNRVLYTLVIEANSIWRKRER